VPLKWLVAVAILAFIVSRLLTAATGDDGVAISVAGGAIGAVVGVGALLVIEKRQRS
jgi:hypothetical protein